MDESLLTCTEDFTISLINELVNKTVFSVGQEFETNIDVNDNDSAIAFSKEATVINVNNDNNTEGLKDSLAQNKFDFKTTDSAITSPKDATVINVNIESSRDLENNSENSAQKTQFVGIFSQSKASLNKQKHLFLKRANKKLTKQLVKSNISNLTLKVENKELQSKCQKLLDIHSCAKTTKSIQTNKSQTDDSQKLVKSFNNLNNLQDELHKVSFYNFLTKFLLKTYLKR